MNRTHTGGSAGRIALPPITGEVNRTWVPSDAKADVAALVDDLKAQDIGFIFVIMPTAEAQPGFAAAARASWEARRASGRRTIGDLVNRVLLRSRSSERDGAAQVGSLLADQLRVRQLSDA